MCEIGVCDRHFTVQHISARRKILSQPYHPVNVMTVECTTQGLRWRGALALLFPPGVYIGHRSLLVKTIDVHPVHAGARGFESDNLRSLVQSAIELKHVVKEISYQCLLPSSFMLCS